MTYIQIQIYIKNRLKLLIILLIHRMLKINVKFSIFNLLEGEFDANKDVYGGVLFCILI